MTHDVTILEDGRRSPVYRFWRVPVSRMRAPRGMDLDVDYEHGYAYRCLSCDMIPLMRTIWTDPDKPPAEVHDELAAHALMHWRRDKVGV